MRPLNGTRTHPLSAHAIAELRNIAADPVPCCSINPGVINRLRREDLAAVVALPSPFKTHKDGKCPHLQVTSAGIERLREIDCGEQAPHG